MQTNRANDAAFLLVPRHSGGAAMMLHDNAAGNLPCPRNSPCGPASSVFAREGDKSWISEEAHCSGCSAYRCRSSCCWLCSGITDARNEPEPRLREDQVRHLRSRDVFRCERLLTIYFQQMKIFQRGLMASTSSFGLNGFCRKRASRGRAGASRPDMTTTLSAGYFRLAYSASSMPDISPAS